MSDEPLRGRDEHELEGGHDHDEEHHGHADGDTDDHGHRDHDDTHDHHHHHDVETVRYAVVTVSTSRSLDDDPAGDAIEAAVEDNGGEVTVRNLVPDDYDKVQAEVHNLVGRDDVDAVVTTGGTGVTPDDVTVEATEPLFDKTLPGFGELFRRLSYDEIGTKVVGTRAVAGVADGVPVFCLPGSENAVRLGVEEIVVREAGHLVGLAQRDDGDDEE
jgi:molybdenum cofactor biosynthesis protein B